MKKRKILRISIKVYQKHILTFSAGIAPYTNEKKFESWVQKANEALYYAKEHGIARIEML